MNQKISKKKLPRKRFEGAMGICRECYEVTEVLKPCCDGEVEYNSIIFGQDDFEKEVK